MRHGVRSVLVLNGHGGNTGPIQGAIDSWRHGFKGRVPAVNLQSCACWDLIPKNILDRHMKTRIIPGHAKEFETSIGLALFPENVRQEVMPQMEDKDLLLASAEKGRVFVEEAVSRTVEFLQGMMDGRIQPPPLKHFP